MDSVYFCEICNLSRFVDVEIVSEDRYRCNECHCHMVERMNPEQVIDFDVETEEDGEGGIYIRIYNGSVVVHKNAEGLLSLSANITAGVSRSIVSLILNKLNPRLCVDLDGTLGMTPRHLMPRFSNQVRDAFFRLFPSLQPRPPRGYLELPSHIANEEEKDQTCSICLENLNENEIIELPCHHSFHKECILLWLSSNNTCPYCREVIQVLQPNEEPLGNVELD